MKEEAKVQFESVSVTGQRTNEIIEIFNESVLRALMRFDEEGMESLSAWIDNVYKSFNPFFLITAESIGRITGMVFSEEKVRDFIFLTSSLFFSRFDSATGEYEMLVENLTQAVLPFNVESTKALPVPKEIVDRFDDANSVKEVLLNNKWIAIIVMLTLYYDTKRIEKLISKGSKH